MIGTIILVCTILVLYLLYTHRCYSFFKRLGINGPSPTFFLGNVLDFGRTKRISISIRNWTKLYGRIYGYFEGHTPVLVVSDPDILEKIFRTHFKHFHSRRQFPLEERSSSKGVHLFSATGDEWRRQRSIINPTFSQLKMKGMIPLINECITNLVAKLEESVENTPNGFDIYKLFKSLTMDLIWRCCFGIKTDMQNNLDNPYFVRSQQVFANQNNTYLATLLGIFIPELQPVWLAFHCYTNAIKSKLRELLPWGDKLIADDPNEWIKRNVESFVETASKNPNETDLLHLMLMATENNAENANQSNPKKKTLTLDEVKQNIYLFMLAGYETASTALAYITYVLAKHPDEQKALRDYIDSFLLENRTIDFDLLNEMKELDWFIRETLRMYPITPIVTNRQCSQAIDIPGLGVIQPGTKLTLDIYNLHYDPNLWGPVDPNIFYPKRFAQPRHPLAWVAFGAGPRQCVGMKFAFAEMKMVIISLLKMYEVSLASSDSTDLEFVELVTIAPKEVRVQLKRRTDR